ncbi:MAG TPA: hypothetical protein VHS96_05880, partial [Bacteroidia bacterium]|nr:hypothetical protein [Bacteroidia bacterium]
MEKLHVLGNVRVSNLAGVGTRMVGSDANGTLVNIAAGTNGQVLTQTAGGPAWQPITAWQTTGNAGTVVATNFMGSTDNVDVAFRTNNTETFRMTTGQRVGIGTTAPAVKLDVNSAAGDAIWGHSANVGGYLGYETNFVVGSAGAIQGAGVWAANPTAGYTSSYAQSSGAATVAANINFSSVWISSYNLVDNASATFNPPGLYSQLNVTNATLGGDQIAVRAFSDRGTTGGNPGYTVGVEGLSNTQSQDAFAVQGIAFTNSTTRGGGYFESLNYAGTSQAFAYVGSTVGLARKITGTNAVSEIIPTPNHGRITMTAPEAPEYWYYDYGSVNLVNGQAHVDIDPIMADIVVIDANNPVRVFATPVGMLNYNGVTVMNQTSTGFDLVEVNGGNHSGKLDYQLVLRPKTGYGEGRFPQAPGPNYLKASEEPLACKAANQPDLNNIFYWPAD